MDVLTNDRAHRVVAAVAIALSAACAPDEAQMTTVEHGSTADAARLPDGMDAMEMQRRVAQFAPVQVTFDESLLDERQRQAVKKLVQASDILDGLFRDQVWAGNRALAQALADAQGPGMDAAREYFDIMYGPWDRLEEDLPFLNVGPKPEGAGYYPEGVTREEIDAWLEAHPEDEATFSSYFTVIRRDGGESLIAVPYSEAYRTDLEEAARLLREAAELSDNESLKRFLETRADAFLSNDYFGSDVAWMRISDNLIDPTIGPYEVYEDNLKGQKAAFESFIAVRDPTESARLDELVSYMPDLEAALPVPDEYKYLDRPFTSPISVVTEVYAAGDTRAGVQTLAFNLPNDPRVREQEGSKKVMLTNIIQAKFEKILKPIAETLMNEDQVADVNVGPFYTSVLVHELAHGLGPDYVTGRDGVTVNQALAERYSAFEEAKADVVGVHSLGVLSERGVYDADFQRQVYTSHAASLFRCVRFGVTEAHGKGCLMQFNYFLERGALRHDPETGRFSVDLEVIPGAISDLAREFLVLQATGDYDGAGEFMERYGQVPEILSAAIDKLEAVPVDIRPTYSVKEMMESW